MTKEKVLWTFTGQLDLCGLDILKRLFMLRFPLTLSARWTVLGLLFFLLFVAYNPWGYDPFLLPKEVAALWVLLAFCAFGTHALFSLRFPELRLFLDRVPAGLPILLILTWCLFLVPSSSSPLLSIRFFIVMVLLVSLYISSAGILSTDSVFFLWGWLLLGGVITSLAGLAQYYGYIPDTSFGYKEVRSTGFFFGNPNHYGGALGCLIPLGLGLIFSRKFFAWRWLIIFIVGLLVFSLLYTKTLGAIIPAAASTSLFFIGVRNTVLKDMRWPRKTWILAGLAFVVLIGLFLMLLHERLGQITRLVLSRDLNQAMSYRLTAVQTALAMFEDRPLIGVGPGGFVASFFDYRSWNIIFGSGINDDPGLFETVHNDHLQILVELGLPGFLLWVWILVSFGKYVVRSLGLPGTSDEVKIILISGASSLSFSLLNALIHFPFHVATSTIIPIFVMGGIAGVTSLQSDKVATPGPFKANNRPAHFMVTLFFVFLAFLASAPLAGDIIFRQGRDHLANAYKLQATSPGEYDSLVRRALNDFILAKKLNPYHPMTRLGLAEVYNKKKDYPLAYDQNIILDSIQRDEASVCMLAISLHHRGDNVQARRLINRALVFNHLYAPGWNCLEYLDNLPENAKP
ncbi:MAG: O-antigen ligase family protein [Deltaproteobacteria bacterium]|nr:O-antigen ligase family protein [Deltaproteobacteria bacterium]